MERGLYWGGTIARREEPDVLLTLTRYEPNTRFPRHVHLNPGIFFLVRGDHEERRSSGTFIQEPLTCVWHAADEPHETVVGEGGMIGLNISFGSAVLAEVSKCVDEHRFVRSPFVRRQAIDFLRMATGKLPNVDVQTKLCDALAAVQLRDESTPPPWLKNVRDAVHARFREDIRIGSLGAEIGVHPVHLARVFRAHYGSSLTDYVQALRIEEALRLLREPEVTIAMAAALSGFSDQAHLGRLVRRHHRSSVQELRRSVWETLPCAERESR